MNGLEHHTLADRVKVHHRQVAHHPLWSALESLALADIASETGLGKNKAFRILKTLEKLNDLEVELERKRKEIR